MFGDQRCRMMRFGQAEVETFVDRAHDTRVKAAAAATETLFASREFGEQPVGTFMFILFSKWNIQTDEDDFGLNYKHISFDFYKDQQDIIAIITQYQIAKEFAQQILFEHTMSIATGFSKRLVVIHFETLKESVLFLLPPNFQTRERYNVSATSAEVSSQSTEKLKMSM